MRRIARPKRSQAMRVAARERRGSAVPFTVKPA
jgi:hypothetical protein